MPPKTETPETHWEMRLRLFSKYLPYIALIVSVYGNIQQNTYSQQQAKERIADQKERVQDQKEGQVFWRDAFTRTIGAVKQVNDGRREIDTMRGVTDSNAYKGSRR